MRPAGSCLGDSQGEGTAGPAARTAKIARVPARSIHRHACCSGSGDHGGRDRDLQLLTAHDVRGQRGPVDDYDRRRNKLATIYGEKKALLHFSKRDRGGRE